MTVSARGDAHGRVLAAMTGERWRMIAEIADDTGLPGTAVRLALHDLRAEGLVWRSIRGEWRPASPVEAAAGRER